MDNKNKFKPVESQISFPEIENDIIDFWKKNKIFEKSVESRPADNTYTFYDGPPFITGFPHHGNLLPSIAKDLIPRYWTMKGKRVWGWDCHGLPTENKVEKKLGLKSKKDIERIGIKKYIDECYSYVTNVSQEWEWYIDHIGRWVDFKNAYKTMDLDYMETVMWVFAQIYKKGLIYKGKRTSLYCPHCATPLSNFEIAMDNSYKMVEDPAVFIKFKLDDGRSLMAWTTTPWTLPGNLALAIDKKEKYTTVDYQGEKLIVAKKRISHVFKDLEYKQLDTFLGSKLIGLSYKPLYDYYLDSVSENDYKIYHGDFVSMEDGTGVVHIAPSFGEEDFEFGKQEKLSSIDHVDEEGKMVDKVSDFSGLFVKKADAPIIEDLKNKNLLFKTEKIKHSYPFCYRCQTPLIYKSQIAWYLKIDQIRQTMLDTNKQINWVPQHIKTGRFKQGIKTAPDWCLSRSRYWASPLPVWECQCGYRFVPESIKELEKMSGQKVTNLHKPDIDLVTVKCPDCGKQVNRVPEVLDCWFESGSMPYGERHYPFQDKDKFDKEFPADYIIEYIAQTRGWFYTLHVISNALFGKPSFKNCVVTGVIMGKDGRKMSKLFNNYPDPKMVIEKYGGEALRLYFMESVVMLGENIKINENEIAEKVKTILLPLYNTYKYLVTYANLHNWQPQLNKSDSTNILDRWIVEKTKQLTSDFSTQIEKYNIPQTTRLIQPFIENLSRWYIRQSRQRFVDGDKQALQTLWNVLIQFTKTVAPVIPFITDYLWQKLAGDIFGDQVSQSVHLETYPPTEKYDQQLLDQMNLVRQICEQGNMLRKTNNISTRQPLAKATIDIQSTQQPSDDLSQIIENELNIKQIEFNLKKNKLKVDLDINITPQLGREGDLRNMIRQIQVLRKEANLNPSDKITIQAPDWPKEFEDELLQKTSAISIQKSNQLKINKL